MSVTIQLRRGTAAAWTSANPVLAVGEIGVETDTLAYKLGDGTTAWTSLGYRELTGEHEAALFDVFDAGTEPSAPASGKMIIYAKSVAGRNMPKFMGPSGLDSPLQPALWANGADIILPASSTAFTAIGTGTFTAVGTVSHPTLAAGSLRASTRRAIVTSAASSNSASELRIAATRCWRGDAAGLGGFFNAYRFGCSSAVAGQRVIVGLTSSTSATSTSQSPSSLTSCVFIGNDAGDANLQIMHNDASGSCTKVDLGASFPVPSSSNNAMYDVIFFAAPNASTIGYRVSRLESAATASGTLSTDLPPSTTFLAPHVYVNNNAVASAVILDFYRYYLESDY